ncbi:MAG: cell division protein FtsQ/DivIB [Gammaproteobacteria bacterium]
MKLLQQQKLATPVVSKSKQSWAVSSFRIGRIIVLLFLVLSLLWFGTILHNPKTAPIKFVNIAGQYKHINPAQLQRIMLPYLNTGFFGIDLADLKAHLLEIPWVQDVTIKRIWPNTVNLVIKERQPFALWNESSLLTLQGEVFTPSRDTLPSQGPHFMGPVGQQKWMLDNYKHMLSILQPLGLGVQEIELTKRQAWRLKLTNGLDVILGREDIFPRLERFVGNYGKIIGPRNSQVEYVDLRYTNGLAIKWRPMSEIKEKVSHDL